MGENQAISSIEVEYNGTSEIATYTLSYSTGETGQSQLDDVALSRGAAELSKTVFTWQDGESGWTGATNTNKAAGSNHLMGDFDNDGNMDIFVNLSGTWQVYRGTDSGKLSAALDSGPSSSTSPIPGSGASAHGPRRCHLQPHRRAKSSTLSGKLMDISQIHQRTGSLL